MFSRFLPRGLAYLSRATIPIAGVSLASLHTTSASPVQSSSNMASTINHTPAVTHLHPDAQQTPAGGNARSSKMHSKVVSTPLSSCFLFAGCVAGRERPKRAEKSVDMTVNTLVYSEMLRVAWHTPKPSQSFAHSLREARSPGSPGSLRVRYSALCPCHIRIHLPVRPRTCIGIDGCSSSEA